MASTAAQPAIEVKLPNNVKPVKTLSQPGVVLLQAPAPKETTADASGDFSMKDTPPATDEWTSNHTTPAPSPARQIKFQDQATPSNTPKGKKPSDGAMKDATKATPKPRGPRKPKEKKTTLEDSNGQDSGGPPTPCKGKGSGKAVKGTPASRKRTVSTMTGSSNATPSGSMTIVGDEEHKERQEAAKARIEAVRKAKYELTVRQTEKLEREAEEAERELADLQAELGSI